MEKKQCTSPYPSPRPFSRTKYIEAQIARKRSISEQRINNWSASGFLYAHYGARDNDFKIRAQNSRRFQHYPCGSSILSNHRCRRIVPFMVQLGLRVVHWPFRYLFPKKCSLFFHLFGGSRMKIHFHIWGIMFDVF